MNIRGIEFLRRLKLPVPRKEIISRDLSKIDLEELYLGAQRGATIIAFDYSEKINQNLIFEKNVREYKIKKKEYFLVLENLIEKLSKEGVEKQNMIFLTHQTYVPQEISLSRRISLDINEESSGRIIIEIIKSLRKANSNFNPDFVYQCPIIGGRVFRSEGQINRKNLEIRQNLISRLISDLSKIPGNPYADFEVYSDTGELFYHDLFLNLKKCNLESFF